MYDLTDCLTGFIRQFGTVYDQNDVLQLNALHVSLWSGFYFVAQVVFQCISPFIVDHFGRRVGMYCFTGFMLTGESDPDLIYPRCPS